MTFLAPLVAALALGLGGSVRDVCADHDCAADVTPPEVSAGVLLASLWPPNHKLVDVRLSISATDHCDADPTTTVEVWSDEDNLAPGSGNFSPDAVLSGAEERTVAQLRSERSGTGDGRVYLIIVRATDDSGNAAHDCCTVVVRHDDSAESVAKVTADAIAAEQWCDTTGTAPAGYVRIDGGPVVGKKK